ncbi:putative vitellogenin receptor yl [Temnothorax americanus]|uniref:putative vitellogenin receptor yl n=1 Tax=Temnothorax americanus TaxID=1964332 RepID=UPI004067EFE4
MSRLVVLLFTCSFLCLSTCHIPGSKNYNEIVPKCPPGKWPCDSGECVWLGFRCDNFKDCKDGSDEKNCDAYYYDEFDDFVIHKPSFRFKCEKNQYKCKNNKECIPKAKFCDVVKDCLDGSDEYDNCVRDLNCTDRFRCNDQHCVLQEWVCDGSKDCPDGSDEWNCSANKTSSASDCKTEKSQYLCGNQRCIALNAVCNKKDDCGDGSDEGAGCTLSNCTLAKCNHECQATPKGSVCTCKPGYTLQNNNRTCKDIDECQIYGICDQECINSLGSYKCQCQEDYSLLNDKKTCKARGEATLTFSTSTSVKKMYVDSKITFTLAKNLNRAVAVTTNNDVTYWSDMKENSETIVREIGFLANRREVIVTTGLSMISGIAVDWITENIYFTDEGYNRIGVCTNDTNCTVLVNGLVKPTGITLLPTRGKMYWSDGDSNGRIAVAGMDGKNIRTFISEKLSWPKSLTFDYPNDRLYWVDSKSNIVESIRLDGTDRRIVQHDIIQEPYALGVFENTLYWSDWGSNTIQSCNKFSGKNWRILHRTQNKPYGIHIDHSAIKPKIDNPCKSNPCSQLCVLNQKKGYTCACTLDKELNADNHTCRDSKKKPHLLIVTDKAFINYYHEWLGKPKMTNVSNLQYVRNVISDPLSGQVLIHKKIWLNNGLVSDVMHYDPVSNTFENITRIHTGYEEVAFDYIGNNLYTSNTRNNSIEVYNIKTLAMTVFHYYFQDRPLSIALAPEESKMFVLFVTFRRWRRSNFDIYEVRMDGLGERKLVTNLTVGPNLPLMYYDRDSRTLFLGDSNAGSILSYSNNDTHVFRTGLKPLRSLTVAGDNIFWTETNELKPKALYRTSFKAASNHKAVAFHIPDLTLQSTPLVATLRKDVKQQEHDCQKNNGNCSHVCLPSSITSFICACPPGMELSLNDNRTCILHHECPKNEYKCSEHNLCIKMEQLCDGIAHCPNGEDETIDCKEKGKRCKEDQFMCKNGECISSKGRCNSHFDCADQSDEENCKKPKCRKNEFQCRDGTCILDAKACNGVFDCGDYSDEQFSYCKSRTCAPDRFMCNEGNCIPKSFVCDGQPDCVNALDEAHCKPFVNISSISTNRCQNGYFQCANNNCISLSLKCDGIDDCHDGSDERHCSSELNYMVNCTANEYHCLNTNLCLPKKVRCNGVDDCPGHDDEHDCNLCFEGEFACDNKKCIREFWVCDEYDDCGDNSDEKNCDGNKKMITESGKCDEFKCFAGTCLPYSKVCDGNRDCPDGSDENGKCQSACTRRDNYCKGVCYKTPLGAACGCQDGYRLAADMISCEDVNECEQDVCSQICRNTVGSYECSCYDGYIPRYDKVSCRAIGPTMEFITASENDIRRISSNLHFVEIIDSLTDSSVSGLDVNAVHDIVYWSSDEFGTIKKINVATKKISTVRIVEHPQALAVDWITGNVYVIDNGRPNTIKVCDLEKQICATLVKIEDNKAKVVSLIVDPINKLLFWTQITWDTVQPSSKIYRADMMGLDIKMINSHTGFVTGMVIDHIKSKLYWSDSYLKTIESSNLDGSQNSTFLVTNIHRPLGIGMYEQSLYWFMGSNGQLQSCKLYGKKQCETIDLGTNNIHKYFAIHHISTQPSGKNSCDEKYCDYMCVLKKDNATCICSDGQPIQSNSTCSTMNEVKHASRSSSSLRNTRNTSGVYSITIIVLLVGVLALCVYYYYQKNRLKSKSASDLSCSSIRFQNPSYDRSDEVEVTLNSIATDLAPGQHEYVNPIDDKFLKTAMEYSTQRSDECSKEKDVEETDKESALLYFAN